MYDTLNKNNKLFLNFWIVLDSQRASQPSQLLVSNKVMMICNLECQIAGISDDLREINASRIAAIQNLSD